MNTTVTITVTDPVTGQHAALHLTWVELIYSKLGMVDELFRAKNTLIKALKDEATSRRAPTESEKLRLGMGLSEDAGR